MNEKLTEILSCFVDGEPVDPDALALALEDASARRALVDFVRLSHDVRADQTPLPASMASLRRRVPLPHLLRWPAVAALLVIVFLAGLKFPRPAAQSNEETPPAPTRVEQFVPGVDWHQ